MKQPRTHYVSRLNDLKAIAEKLPNTRMLALAKINALILMNMTAEPMFFNKNLSEHPFDLLSEIIQHAINQLSDWAVAAFIEDDKTLCDGKSQDLETKHQALFQDLWTKFSEKEYNERIERYVHRLKINGLADDFLKGKRCIDLGCGHGNFAHALRQAGASYVLGIDFGENSIRYAESARARLGDDKIEFKLASVYDLPAESESFDFAIQNGVFHHLEDEDAAIREAHRVLKTGGHMWYYTDGEGGAWFDMWDTSHWILRNVPHSLIVEHLKYLNVGTNKRYHLGDGLNATYRHTTWEKIAERLESVGFGSFRRLVGGFPTDFDHDVIAADPFGREKFGSGDLRILVQKMR